jgi:hypothetical protein
VSSVRPDIPEDVLVAGIDGLVHYARALQGVLDDRERELIEALGPCLQKSTGCRLHNRHSGPCDFRKATET